jgi:hypothetical protein
MESVSDVSETVPVSVITGWHHEHCCQTLYLQREIRVGWGGTYEGNDLACHFWAWKFPKILAVLSSLDVHERIHWFTIVVTCRGDYRRVLDWMIGFIAPYTFTARDYRQYGAIADLHTLRFTVTHTLGFSVFTSRILATDLSVSL